MDQIIDMPVCTISDTRVARGPPQLLGRTTTAALAWFSCGTTTTAAGTSIRRNHTRPPPSDHITSFPYRRQRSAIPGLEQDSRRACL